MNRGNALSLNRLPYAAPQPAAVQAVGSRTRWGFAELFIISQTALPALMYLPGTQGLRQSIRLSAFVISLAGLGWWLLNSNKHRPPHRSYVWIGGVTGLLVLMVFHPSTSSLYGGLAHTMLYLAVLAPFFWAPMLVHTPEHLARLIGLLLLCCGVNSVVGVLQVYDPATYMPVELSRIITQGTSGVGPLTYIGANGQVVVRPPGLFDTPGAVAGPAMCVALLGSVFGLSALPLWVRVGSFGLAAAGIAAIYLTQVRISIVMVVLMFLGYTFALLGQRRVQKATTIAAIGGTLGTIAFALALSLGGPTISERFLTLFAGDPVELYYNARGIQLSYGLRELLFEYPFGAGLARWGMAGAYYGSGKSIWAELQVNGWLIDGGIPMLVMYGIALVQVAYSQYRLALSTQHPRLAACAAVVFALSLGPIALVFSFTPFVTQIGIQFWFLAGALHGVACTARLQDA
jgi:hypothetical protein